MCFTSLFAVSKSSTFDIVNNPLYEKEHRERNITMETTHTTLLATFKSLYLKRSNNI